jgi:hypothetical protein
LTLKRVALNGDNGAPYQVAAYGRIEEAWY